MNTFLLYHNRKWNIPDKMLWKESAWKQDRFIRDIVCGDLLRVPAFVVSGHRSKSINLPVYGFVLRNGVKVICRDNFYDWKLSIELPRPLSPASAIPSELISDGETRKIDSCYLEGFKDEWSYDAYDRNNTFQTKFTIEVYGDYKFWTIMFILKNAFPEIEINPETDTRDLEDIAKAIHAIYDANGVDEYDEEYEKQIGYRTSYMSGWELLLNTYWVADHNKYNDELIAKKYEKDERGFYPICGSDVFDDPALVAEIIKEHQDVHREFLLEERMFNEKF